MELTIDEAQKVIAEAKLIEQRREEWVTAYGENVKKLQGEIKNLGARKNSLQEEFYIKFSDKIKALQTQEDELRNKIVEAENKNSVAAMALKEAQAKLTNAEHLEILLSNKHEEHDNNVAFHISSTEEQKESIRQRHAESMDKEEQSKILLAEAQKKLEITNSKEAEMEQKALRLVHISENIQEDIEKQSKMKLENEALLKEMEKTRVDLVNIQAKIDFDKTEGITLRDSVDAQTARLGKRKLELDEKEKLLKASQIRLEVAMNGLTAKEQNINDQLTKLSQMKTDVDMLLKQKEAKEA